MERFSDHFYKIVAEKIDTRYSIYDSPAEIIYGDKNVEIKKNDVRIVKFYGIKKMVVRNRIVVRNYSAKSFAYIIGIIK